MRALMCSLSFTSVHYCDLKSVIYLLGKGVRVSEGRGKVDSAYPIQYLSSSSLLTETNIFLLHAESWCEIVRMLLVDEVQCCNLIYACD